MKKVGIIGGVGPEASNKFCELLIKYKSKTRDQDNIPFVHFCNPQIPDRADFIFGRGEDPVPEMVKTCNQLKDIGMDFLVIPCNTAHYFLPEIQEQVSLPIIDIIKVLAKKIKLDNLAIKKVGVLATTASVRSELHKNHLKNFGIDVVLPNEEDQEIVSKAIYQGIKAGKKIVPRKLLTSVAEKLIEEGAEAIILGCTEIPLVLKQKNFDIKLYDPMEIVAKEIINLTSAEEKEVLAIKYVTAENRND